MNNSADHRLEIFALLVLLAFGTFWYFGRTYPLEPRRMSQQVVCERCDGSGMMKCSVCNGFGSVEEPVTCPACDGSGKHRWKITHGPDAPCPKCLGTGKVTAREACESCGKSGKQVCTQCGGEGMVASEAQKIDSVFMCPSLWERALALVGFSIPSNPCPQRLHDGSYPLVQRFLSVRFKRKDIQVVTWGRFTAERDQWRMMAEIAHENHKNGASRKWVEFFVKDRLLAECRLVEHL